MYILIENRGDDDREQNTEGPFSVAATVGAPGDFMRIAPSSGKSDSRKRLILKRGERGRFEFHKRDNTIVTLSCHAAPLAEAVATEKESKDTSSAE